MHHAAPELYGHVVATDAFGDAYVIPAPDTLKNIQECMGAAAVTLPTHKDFTTTTSGEDSNTKSRVDPNSNLEFKTSHQISLDAEAKSPAVSSDVDQGTNPYDSSGSQDTVSTGHEGFYAEYSPAHTLVDGYEDGKTFHVSFSNSFASNLALLGTMRHYPLCPHQHRHDQDIE